MKLTKFESQVYAQVSKIPKGKVKTYGQIAREINNSKAARAVGNALHKNPFKSVACHRVVNSAGRLAKNFGFNGPEGQRKRLLKEGVTFKKRFTVNLDRHLLKSQFLSYNKINV